MKRYIRNSSELGDDIILRAVITIDIELPILIAAATQKWSDYTKFPGKDKFRQDVIKVLEDEYKFEILEDDYSGSMQKGWVSNNEDSPSLYLNTLYDLRNAQEALDRADYRIDASDVEGKVYCYILFRISDHSVDNQFSEEHKNFYNANKEKHTLGRNDVLITDDDTILIDEVALWRHYKDAIDTLRYEIEGRISAWVRIAKKYNFTK